MRYIAPNGKHCLLLRLWDLCDEHSTLQTEPLSWQRHWCSARCHFDCVSQTLPLMALIIKISQFYLFLIACMYMCMLYECWTVCIDQTTTFGSWCLLSFQHVWVPGLNSGCQAWQQPSLPTEPLRWLRDSTCLLMDT